MDRQKAIAMVFFFVIAISLTFVYLNKFDSGVKPYDPNPHVVFNYMYDATNSTIIITITGGHELPDSRTDRLLVEIDPKESGEVISKTWISDGSGYNNGGKGYPVQEGDVFEWTDSRINSNDVVRIIYEGANAEDEHVIKVLDEATIPSAT